MATDLGLEIFKLVGTGVSVFVGAKLAWDNASKGRREDILFKEKYKAFEKQIGYLITVDFHLEHLHDSLKAGDKAISKLHNSPIALNTLADSQEKHINALKEISADISVNRTAGIFNSVESYRLYSECIDEINYLVFESQAFSTMIRNANLANWESLGGIRSYNSIMNRLNYLAKLVRRTAIAIYLEQEFPRTRSMPVLIGQSKIKER